MRRRILFISHRLEAEVFIDGYGLSRRILEDGQVIFAGSQSAWETELLLLGQGQSNAELSIARYLKNRPVLAGDCWLNFGTAGSAEFSIGTIVVGNRLVVGETDASIRPLNISTTLSEVSDQVGESVVRCVSQIETDYQESGVYEMESGTVANFVQKNDVRLMLLKLVTDGPNRPASTLSQNYIRDLIGSRSSILLELGDKLFGLTTGS